METKAWYKSKGIWGGIVTIAAVVINLLFGQGTVTESELMEAITALIAAVGGIVALYGRIVAQTKVTR